ncbi:BamA/TamA family outer membrane protein [Flammeovirga kamogawensis]|uniref:Outer membrane protein assembly factor n=1 Tax=Flammeovirga kamogawensis TaxID=373891 RepID=A0ABX8GWV9_9BACT|nr:BamA/TamA family outer membrane protein [Flammeovirga kamogawensis]MBB6461126.1 outer membrane protein assembly factor BamA [Flammeovirga kamogawensis]QWG07692.1 outer membrane protein assembly factor [Flammeovirga kamogawensis]TRX69501.1 BamA/TamA family outer membrane protein [Flammeovirga kamogawensis]
MRNTQILILLTSVLLFFNQDAFAQGDDLSYEIDTLYKRKFTGFPYPAYAQETSWEFGVVSVFQFKPGKASFATRPSNATFIGFYTLENQMRLKLEHTVFTNNEDWLLEGTWEYAKYPEKYYGIGNETPSSNEQLMDWSKFDFRQQLLRKIKENMFVGLQYRYANFWDISVTPREDGSGSLEEIPGYEGGVNSGLGLVYKWDTRDIVLVPSSGHFIEFRAAFYPTWLGSDYKFTSIKLDMRKYFDLGREKEAKTILAFQGIINQTYGDAPFREISLMGGLNMMRGVYEGRYRDNHMIAAQAEIRQHLFWRLGMTAFISTAEVMNEWNDFDVRKLKLAGGAGFRLTINKEDRATLRADYGVGPDGSSGLYLTFGEAF